MNNFSKMGFILATIGSSIGLGHIWRFPYLAGNNGGGAFILIYLLLALSIGVAILIAEMVIGNKTNKNVVDAFVELDPNPKKPWRFAGITLFGGPIILTFYCVVLGWVLYYTLFVAFNLPTDLEQSKLVFTALTGKGIIGQFICYSVVLWLTAWIISRGVKDGIEKLNFILMPLLFIIFIGLLIYALTMPSIGQALYFMFAPDFSKINTNVLVEALGQVFFALSIGLGTIITYAATTDSSQNLFKSSLYVVLSGIVVSLIAGIMIFTFLFAFNGEPAAGVGLVFMALPQIFSHMGVVGNVVFFLFLVTLLFAGITSTVSILEPAVAYAMDRLKWSRSKASYSITFVIYIVGSICLLSFTDDFKDVIAFGGKNLFDWMDWVTSTLFLPLGGLASVVFLAFIVGKEKCREFTKAFFSPTLFEIWFFLIKYVSPVVILVILSSKLI